MCVLAKDEFFGSVVSPQVHSETSASANPLLGENALHWVFCLESYSSSRRPQIDDWVLVGETVDTCMYRDSESERAIVAFRGTQTLSDIKSDVQLSRPGGDGCDFNRMGPAMQMLEEFIEEFPDVAIQLTGHSLGGAIARCAGQRLSLGIVTFNSAAPPSHPVYTGPNEIDYHIAFDIISAWQNPNTVRIDLGYRPRRVAWYDPRKYKNASLETLLKAHSLSNFAGQKGRIISVQEENSIWQGWYKSLPRFIRRDILDFIQVNQLPPLPGV